jgi:hypothetical protein
MTTPFETWYAKVDRHVSALAGVGIDDLADGNSYDAYEDGVSPKEYALDRLREEGFPF